MSHRNRVHHAEELAKPEEVANRSASLSSSCRSVLRILQTNKAHVVATIIGGICCFLPIIAGTPSNLEYATIGATLRGELSNELTLGIALVSLAFIVPLALDLAADLTLQVASWVISRKYDRCRNGSGDQKDSFFNDIEKILFIVGVVMAPSCIVSPATPRLALSYSCAIKCQSTFVFGAVASSLNRCDDKYFPGLLAFVNIILVGLGNAIGAFIVNQSNGNTGPLNSFRLIISFGAGLILAIQGLVWMCLKIRERFRARETLQSAAGVNYISDADAKLFFQSTHILMYVVALILFICAIVQTGSFAFYNDYFVFLISIPYAFYTVSLSVFSMRLVKYNVIRGLVALLEAKKQYVRYISHEIRTPLNAMFLGLQLLSDDLQSCASASAKDAERYENLCDVHLSCTTALDILNDLLTFEKLDSGILELHKEEVVAEELISDCVKMFNAQAKARDVTIAVQPFGSDSGSGSAIGNNNLAGADVGALPLESYDMISLDKFKIAQVIRNLISNALKFTPPGGSVTVTPSFVPYAEDRSVRPPTESRANRKLWRFFLKANNEVMNMNIEPNGDTEPRDNSATKGRLRITVTDTGAGISPENQKKLFKEVVQFNPDKLQGGGGSGFGLFLCTKIVDVHGGTVSVYSEGEGKGTTFTLELPMSRGAQAPIELAMETPRGEVRDAEMCDERVTRAAQDRMEGPTQGSVRGLVQEQEEVQVPEHSKEAGRKVGPSVTGLDTSVQPESKPSASNSTKQDACPKPELLVVDDSHLNRKMLIKVLRAKGYACDEAEDGQLGLAKVKLRMDEGRGEYAAILMDCVMPNMDGPTATRELRKLGYNGLIYGVTGNGLQSDIDHFVSLGAAAVLMKPFNWTEFQRAIANHSK